MFDERREEDGEVVGGEVHVGRDDWREADRQLRRIAKRRAGLDAEEARWLLACQLYPPAEPQRKGGFRSPRTSGVRPAPSAWPARTDGARRC